MILLERSGAPNLLALAVNDAPVPKRPLRQAKGLGDLKASGRSLRARAASRCARILSIERGGGDVFPRTCLSDHDDAASSSHEAHVANRHVSCVAGIVEAIFSVAHDEGFGRWLFHSNLCTRQFNPRDHARQCATIRLRSSHIDAISGASAATAWPASNYSQQRKTTIPDCCRLRQIGRSPRSHCQQGRRCVHRYPKRCSIVD